MKTERQIVVEICIDYDIDPTDEDFEFGLRIAKETRKQALKDAHKVALKYGACKDYNKGCVCCQAWKKIGLTFNKK